MPPRSSKLVCRRGTGPARLASGLEKRGGEKKRLKNEFDDGRQSNFFCSRELIFHSHFFPFLSSKPFVRISPQPVNSDRRKKRSRMQTILATRVGVPLASAKAQARSKATAAPAARIIGATATAKQSLGGACLFFLADSIRRCSAPLAVSFARAIPTQAQNSFVVSGSATEVVLNDQKKAWKAAFFVVDGGRSTSLLLPQTIALSFLSLFYIPFSLIASSSSSFLFVLPHPPQKNKKQATAAPPPSPRPPAPPPRRRPKQTALPRLRPKTPRTL